jgi:hypothetical protein
MNCSAAQLCIHRAYERPSFIKSDGEPHDDAAGRVSIMSVRWHAETDVCMACAQGSSRGRKVRSDPFFKVMKVLEHKDVTTSNVALSVS